MMQSFAWLSLEHKLSEGDECGIYLPHVARRFGLSARRSGKKKPQPEGAAFVVQSAF